MLTLIADVLHATLPAAVPSAAMPSAVEQMLADGPLAALPVASTPEEHESLAAQLDSSSNQAAGVSRFIDSLERLGRTYDTLHSLPYTPAAGSWI